MTWQEHLKKGSLALAREDYTFAQTELALAVKQAQMTAEDRSSMINLYGLLAQSFFRHLDFAQAEPILKRAIDLGSSKRDDENPPAAESTKISWPARARDLISLAEILRSRGELEQSFACLERALLAMPDVPASGNANGIEEFDAMKVLLAHASDKHHGISQDKIKILEAAQLEAEYGQQIDTAQTLITSANSDRSDVVQALTRLAKLSTKLQFLEQSELYLDHACAIAFGANHARQLSIPENITNIKAAAITDLLMTRANFLSCAYDYAAAARCLADLIKWLETRDNNGNLMSHEEMQRLVAPFSGLMEKADLYASARILMKQALEFEDRGDLLGAVSIYDKILAILPQLFPQEHLEIAQVMQFKASSLERLGLDEEARSLRVVAEAIENRNAQIGATIEDRLARMPALVF